MQAFTAAPGKRKTAPPEARRDCRQRRHGAGTRVLENDGRGAGAPETRISGAVVPFGEEQRAGKYGCSHPHAFQQRWRISSPIVIISRTNSRPTNCILTTRSSSPMTSWIVNDTAPTKVRGRFNEQHIGGWRWVHGGAGGVD